MIYTRDINNLFMSPIYTKCKKYYHASLLIQKKNLFLLYHLKKWISLYDVHLLFAEYTVLTMIRWNGKVFAMNEFAANSICFKQNHFFFSTWNKINTYIEIFGISYIWILTVKKTPYFFVGNSIQMCLEYVYRLYILRSRYIL